MEQISKYLYNAPPEELKQKNNFYGNRMVQAKLAKRDFFGGRAILEGEVMHRKNGHVRVM